VTASSVAIANPTAYINTSPAVQTLGVMVTSPEGCISYITIDIRVLPVPVPRTDPPALAPQCDDNIPGDMLETFDLTTNAAYIINNDPNITLHYFESQADAIANVNEIMIPATALVGGLIIADQSVWIRVENNRVDYLGNNCYVLVEQLLTVNPLPIVEQPITLRECDDDTDGLATFTLSEMNTALLGTTQAPTDYAVSYHLTLAEAQSGANPLPDTYINVTNPQTLYVRIENNATGCINATGTVTLAVEQAAFATGPQVFESCDDYNDPYDGIFEIDLTSFEPAILGTQDPLVFLVSYYHNQADAEAGNNAIPLAEAQAYITAADSDQIWVKVENSSNLITPVCYALTTIDITIERYPDPTVVTQNGINTICVDYSDDSVIRDLLLEINNPVAGNYTYQWFENGTAIPGEINPTYLVNTAAVNGGTRTYTVEMTSVAQGCSTMSDPFDVIQSGPASIPVGTAGYTVTNAFEQNQTITVTVEGYGTYQYSLDDGPRQDSTVFENVALGEHTITIWDTEGGLEFSCDSVILYDVQIIDYPHYFTPNGDGIHDTWNIVGLSRQPNAKIYIFDRYGKLLKQISSTGQGWDGTFNGKLMPSTDYWFTVDFMETSKAKQFKAHFSLKR
jgi:gliding motility-associated-like protein